MTTPEEPTDPPAPPAGEPERKPPEKPAGEARAAARSRKPAISAVGVFALLVALVALAGVAAVGWAWYGMRGEQARVAELEGRVAGLDGRLAALQNSAASTRALNRLAARLKSFQQAESDREQAFNRALQSLTARLGAAGNAYREDEVAALMRLAQARLELAHDPAGAERALALADRTLTAGDNPGYAGVRAALAKEIAALQAVPRPDLTGAYAQLGTLADRVDGLPLAGERTPAPPAAAGGSAGWSWHGIANAFKRAFGPLIVVRHGAAARPLLPPDQAWFVRANVRLELATAQLALLERDGEAYRASLKQARRWIDDWFDASAPEVSSFTATLARLASLQLTPPLPTLGAALDALQAVQQGGSAAP